MTREEVKELLKSVRAKKSRLLALQEYINEYRALMSGKGGGGNTSERVSVSTGNSVEERYVKCIDRITHLQNIYDNLFDEMCREEDQLAELMQHLSPTEYEVILNRYLRGIPRKKCAEIMNYSEEGICRIQQRAFKKMAQ